MAQRLVDGPDGGALVTTEKAAEHLGVSVDTFERLVGVKESPITLPGVRDWIRPVNVGKSVRWPWLSIAFLALVLAQRGGPPSEEESE